MTDDDISKVISILGKEHRPDSPYSRRLVVAGYRKALEELADKMDQLSRLEDESRGCDNDWYDLLAWLHTKLKENNVTL